MSLNELRKVQIMQNREWKNINFEQLKKGDVFRLFEPDGTPVKGIRGEMIFIATSDAFLNEDGIWSVLIE